jgi:hypothetical protein
MKDGPCEQHFPDNDAIIALGADFSERSMQALVHHWQKCIANGEDYVERQCFVADNLLYPTVLLCTLYLL